MSKSPGQHVNALATSKSPGQHIYLLGPHTNTWRGRGVRDLTLETLLWEVMLKRSCAEVKRSTSRILAVMGSAVRNTRASVSLKPIVLYTAEKGMRFSVGKTYFRFISDSYLHCCSKDFLFLKAVSYAHKGCVCVLIKTAMNTVIL